MTRRARRSAAAVLVTAAVAASPIPAATASTANGSGYAAALYGSAGSLSVQATGTGLLGTTLAATLAPLVSALNAVASTAAASVVNGLSNAGYTATAQDSPLSPPSSGFPPSCSSGGWSAQNCYSVSNGGSSSAAGALSLNLNALQGYATGDANGYYAAAQTASPSLTALGVSIGSLGVVSSSSTCTASGSCAASSSVSGVSLFGGAVQVRTASGSTGVLQFSVDGGSTWRDTSSLTVPLTLASSAVTLSADGSLLHVKVGLSLGQLLSSLGLGGLLSSLLGLDTSATALNLTVTLASGRTTSSGASGWGLSVGVDLSGTVSITQSVLLTGLIGTASISIPSGITSDPSGLGNLATLQLAYTSATAGSSTTHGPTWYPAGLI